jgi:hypothetical protein
MHRKNFFACITALETWDLIESKQFLPQVTLLQLKAQLVDIVQLQKLQILSVQLVFMPNSVVLLNLDTLALSTEIEKVCFGLTIPTKVKKFQSTTSQKGHLFHTQRKESQHDKFIGGCIFVDQASSFVHIELQSVLTAHATLQGKIAYENFCCEIGVIPTKYLSDNGCQFTSAQYIPHLNSTQQIQRYTGG